MLTSQRQLGGEDDLRAIEALARKLGTDNLHVTDLTYRLSRWALDETEKIFLLSDETGRLLAWIIMQIQFDALDFVCHSAEESDLLLQFLDWEDQRSNAYSEVL